MAESALKPVIGKLRISGSTDGTAIGNVGDRLKVDAVVSSNTSYEVKIHYSEANAVPASVETNIASLIVPAGKTWYIGRVILSGTNIATYKIKKDSTVFGRTFTWFSGPLQTEIDYSSLNGLGFKYTAGQTIHVSVLHQRPFVGDFSCIIQYIEVDA